MLNLPPFKELQEHIRTSTEEDVQRCLRASHLDTADLAALLSPAAGKHFTAMAERSADITAMRFGKTTQIYAPLYVSSFCTNIC